MDGGHATRSDLGPRVSRCSDEVGVSLSSRPRREGREGEASEGSRPGLNPPERLPTEGMMESFLEACGANGPLTLEVEGPQGLGIGRLVFPRRSR